MATKLKNMRLTSVDLVRAGANQEADICLFKSAEATESPAESETNLFKRFLHWLGKSAAEAENEPENPVPETDDQPDPANVYKSAITESLQSIVADENLTAEEKNDMIAKSIGQYHDAMVELLKTEEPEDMGYLLEGLEKSDDEPEEVEKADDDRYDIIEEVKKKIHGMTPEMDDSQAGPEAEPQ